MEYHAVVEAEVEPEVIVPTCATALDLLRSIYSSPEQPLHRRMRAAIAALPFEHPKLAVVASMTAGPGFAAQLEATIARSRGLMLIGPGTKSADGGVADPEGPGDLS